LRVSEKPQEGRTMPKRQNIRQTAKNFAFGGLLKKTQKRKQGKKKLPGGGRKKGEKVKCSDRREKREKGMDRATCLRKKFMAKKRCPRKKKKDEEGGLGRPGKKDRKFGWGIITHKSWEIWPQTGRQKRSQSRCLKKKTLKSTKSRG